MASLQDSSSDAFEVCMLMLQEEADARRLQVALTTIRTILQNIQKDPTSDKFRTLRKENASFKAKVWELQGAQQLMLALGFVDIGDSIVLPDDSNVSTGLQFVEGHLSHCEASDGFTNQAVNSTPPRELTEKEKKLAEERKIQMKRLQREKEERKQITEQIKADRRDVSSRETRDSHAKQRKFGANMKTFKDIGVDLNRGGG